MAATATDASSHSLLPGKGGCFHDAFPGRVFMDFRTDRVVNPGKGELFPRPDQGAGFPGGLAGGNQQQRLLARHGLRVQVVQLSTAKGQMRGEQKSKRGIFLFFKASCQRRSRPFL